ncbi:MAG TPA: shikimate kinase [Candidatus Acidoferrales bacterium]|nr:shikimate kinase [Candidatus Acidoferrales bacterium]
MTGFMGSGKTTVGRLLAERLGWRFNDLDDWIVARAGLTIVEIFRRHGEPAFRTLESEILDRALGEALEQDRPMVIALGGGTLTRPENLARLRQAAAMLVWLDCPLEELLLRCAGMTDRPLFSDEAGFRRLHDERRPLYAQANYRVDAATEPAQVVERILALVRPVVVEA